MPEASGSNASLQRARKRRLSARRRWHAALPTRRDAAHTAWLEQQPSTSSQAGGRIPKLEDQLIMARSFDADAHNRPEPFSGVPWSAAMDSRYQRAGREFLYCHALREGADELEMEQQYPLWNPPAKMLLASMAKVATPSCNYPTHRLPVVHAVMHALAKVVEGGVLPPHYAQVPEWQRAAWERGVKALHASMTHDLDPALFVERDAPFHLDVLERACKLLFPLHKRQADHGGRKPMCMLLDLRGLRGYIPEYDIAEHVAPVISHPARAHMHVIYNDSHLATEEKGGLYLRICLGKDALGRSIFEYVHRLILWACTGPPPKPQKGESIDVCMHLCDAGMCVCLCHLYWGTRAANLRSDPEEYSYMIEVNARTRKNKEHNCLPGGIAVK